MIYSAYRDIRAAALASLLLLAGALASAESALDQLKNSPGASSGYVPPVPRAVCAYCNMPAGGGHKAGCPQGPRPQHQQQQKSSSSGVAAPPVLSPSQQMAVSLAGGLFQGLFSGMFDDSDSQAAAAAAAAAAEKARYEAQARAAMEAAERQRRTTLVAAQRQKRDASDDASMESLRAAMGEGFDSAPKDPLADALNDPAVVDLRGKQGVVQPLRDGDPPAPAAVSRAAVDKAAREAAERRARYEKMLAENADAKVLAQRLAELEEKQAAVREQLLDLKRSANASRRVYEAAEQDVREATDAAMERGMGLAVDALLAGKGKAIEHLKTVKSDSALWKETLQSVEGVDKVAEHINQAADDVDWLNEKRAWAKDLEYLGNRLEILGPYWTFGKSIVESGMDIRKELQAMRSIREQDGLNEAYRAKLEGLTVQNRQLVEKLRLAREEMAKKLGVPLDQIPRPDYDPKPPTRLAVPMPHPND
jgi:hypothetical protein